MAARTRRQEQKDSTRRSVLDAALALFDERGYDDTTLRAVAERAGVALGTIFVHFPDKVALLAAALEEDVGEVVRDAFETLPRGPLRAQLLHLASRFYAFYARRPRLARVLVQNTIFIEGPSRASVFAQVREFLGRVAKLVQAAIERGDLRADLDAHDAALAFWADYFMALVAGLQNPELGVEGQQALLERLLELRFDGIGRPGQVRSRRRRR